MNTQNEDFTTTPDIAEASAWEAAGASFLGIEWRGPRAYFKFADPKFCQKISALFWANNLPLDARRLTDTLKALKTYLFRHSNGGPHAS